MCQTFIFRALQTPWPSGIGGWRELWGLIAVRDRGSWLRVTGSDCFVVYGLYSRKKEHFLMWFFESIKICSSSASECPPHFWSHTGIKSSSMQCWSRFSKDDFALGMSSLVCFTAPRSLRTSLSWGRKDSCCSPLRLHCACPCTITALSWRQFTFLQRVVKGVTCPRVWGCLERQPESRLQLYSDWSQRLSHQPSPCFLREPKPHLALTLEVLMPLQFLVRAWKWPGLWIL